MEPPPLCICNGNVPYIHHTENFPDSICSKILELEALDKPPVKVSDYDLPVEVIVEVAEPVTDDGFRIFNDPVFGDVRTIMIKDDAWLVGKDVAAILGYKNPQKAIRDHVDEEDRTVNDSFTVHGTPATLINESGFYSLVVRSDMPEARKFKHWIPHDVIPSIRKHGMYATDELLDNPEFAIQVFQKLKEERDRNRKKLSKASSLNVFLFR